MNDSEIDAMPAGRVMDNHVEMAMGLDRKAGEPYSTDITAAMEALQAFVDAKGHGWSYCLESDNPGMEATIYSPGRPGCYLGMCSTTGLPGLAVAICRAILKAASLELRSKPCQ